MTCSASKYGQQSGLHWFGLCFHDHVWVHILSKEMQMAHRVRFLFLFLDILVHPLPRVPWTDMALFSSPSCQIVCADQTDWFFIVLYYPLFKIIPQQFWDDHITTQVHWGSGFSSQILGPVVTFDITLAVLITQALGPCLQYSLTFTKWR